MRVRVVSAVLAVLGVGAAFALSSPLYWDGPFERGNWGVTSAVLVLACLFAALGGAVEGLFARIGARWLPVAALVVFSLVGYWPFAFFAGRLSPHDVVPVASWRPVAVSAGWLLYLVLSYLLFRLVSTGNRHARHPGRPRVGSISD